MSSVWVQGMTTKSKEENTTHQQEPEAPWAEMQRETLSLSWTPTFEADPLKQREKKYISREK